MDINLGYPVTVNDPALTAWAVPTLARVAPGKAVERPVRTVLVNARGFGGFNSAMVLRQVTR